jgi:hypothetical protein
VGILDVRGPALEPFRRVLLAMSFKVAARKGRRALIDLQLFKSKTFAASTITQFMTNGVAFAGQMLIPIYLIRACGRSPSATGWLLAPLGVGMICSYPCEVPDQSLSVVGL